MNGIPQGNIMGKRVTQAMNNLGYPPLKGLAPGILEDSRDGLNPMPMINSLFGSGYAKCKLVQQPVGDHFGRLKSSENQEWVRPLFPGDIQYVGGKPTQKRWIFDKWMTQADWQKEYDARDFCPDGSRIANHAEKDCAKPLLKAEGFCGDVNVYEGSQTANTLLTVALVVGVAIAYMKVKLV